MNLQAIIRCGAAFAALALSAAPGAQADVPCQACGPGAHWVDTCLEGNDTMGSTGAVVGIDTTGDCLANMSFVLNGPVTVHRNAAVGHAIVTEITSMILTGGGVALTAGAGLGNGGVLKASPGLIVEQVLNPAMANSTFEVMFEVDLGGGEFVYNHLPLTMPAKIDCVPPDTGYFHPLGCTALYDSPWDDPPPVWRANLVSADHYTYPVCGDGVVNRTVEVCDGMDAGECPAGCRANCTCRPPGFKGPTLPEWALIGLGVVLAVGGAIIVARRQTRVRPGTE